MFYIFKHYVYHYERESKFLKNGREKIPEKWKRKNKQKSKHINIQRTQTVKKKTHSNNRISTKISPYVVFTYR